MHLWRCISLKRMLTPTEERLAEIAPSFSQSLRKLSFGYCGLHAIPSPPFRSDSDAARIWTFHLSILCGRP